MPRNLRAVVAALMAASLLASCYSFATPSYHPAEGRDLVAALARHGVEVTSAIPGDTACEDPGLVANAMRLDVTDPADGADRVVWIHSFRERAWGTSKPPVDACQTAFESEHPEAVVTRLDIPLYRVFGADWSAELGRGVEAALVEAAQAGAP